MKILVPVDGSAHSLRALDVAADMVRTKQAALYVISVAPSIGGMEDHEISPSRRDRHMEIMEKRAADAVTLACETLRKANVASICAKAISTSVSVPDAIIDFAESEGIDLIVMGSRGLSSSSRFKLGSIASQVIKYCPCSIYLVKTPAD